MQRPCGWTVSGAGEEGSQCGEGCWETAGGPDHVQIVFKAVRVDEITKGASLDRQENEGPSSGAWGRGGGISKGPGQEPSEVGGRPAECGVLEFK